MAIQKQKTRASGREPGFVSIPAPPKTKFLHYPNRYRILLTRADDAAATFTNGFSCSQAVCFAFVKDFRIDRGDQFQILSSGHTEKKERFFFVLPKISGGRLSSISYFDPDDLGVDCTYGLVQDFTPGCLNQFDRFTNTGECFTLRAAPSKSLG